MGRRTAQDVQVRAQSFPVSHSGAAVEVFDSPAIYANIFYEEESIYYNYRMWFNARGECTLHTHIN